MGDLLPFGEYRPDVSAYKGQHSPIITNAIPRGDGYGPMRSFTALTGALASACRGFFPAFDDDGALSVFAGTLDGLWKVDNSDFTWIDVTNGDVGALSDIAAGNHWGFAQFGMTVVAVNTNNGPQSYVLGSSTDFGDLAGSPPAAAGAAVVGPFLVLSGLTDNTYGIQWSSRNNIGEWIPGTNEGDVQTFRDGGQVQGVAPGEFGLVFQDRCIRRMTYSPGSAVIFEFDVLSRELGLYAPYSLVKVRDMVFFLSDSGFQMWHPLMGFKAIGREKVDRTFFGDMDVANKHMIVGAADPQSSLVVWTYKSTSSGVGDQFDRMIVYDWVLDRWAGWINLTGEYIGFAAVPGITLESLDNVGNLDALTQSLDSYPTQAANTLAMADINHRIGLLNGPALEVTLETPEVDIGSRAYVSNCRPITDCADVLTSVGGKPRAMDNFSYSAEREVTSIGTAPCRVDNRIISFRQRFPAASTWTYAIGVEPEMQGSGQR